MDGQFNFIFRACVECNQRKAIAERHVSSVTLFNTPARAKGEYVDMEALRKASNDYHPRKKGVLVKASQEQLTFTGRLGSPLSPLAIQEASFRHPLSAGLSRSLSVVVFGELHGFA
ncbi:hypothetical protein D3C86_1823210 [compost metagenome]